MKFSFTVSPGIGAPLDVDALKRYRDAGADQVIVGAIVEDAKALPGEIERLAERLVVPAAKL